MMLTRLPSLYYLYNLELFLKSDKLKKVNKYQSYISLISLDEMR